MDRAEQKKGLRREMRQRLQAMDDASRALASRAIVQRITVLPVWQRAQSVLLFSPLATEPDISTLLTSALQADKEVFFPRVQGNELAIHQVRQREDLCPGSFGVLEPVREHTVRVLPTAVDLAFIPGLAFDRQQHRLGRGKGYYDRLLAWAPMATIGVFYACQQVEVLPVEEHDIRLGAVITE